MGTKQADMGQAKQRKKSGIPTGNAGEYFVMAELLRRGFDAQLADRNTKGYDLLVGYEQDKFLRKVQVKSVRSQPWYVNVASFTGELADQITVYVLVGDVKASKPVRYFLAKNEDLKSQLHIPEGWPANGFMRLAALLPYENNWDIFRRSGTITI